MLPGASAVSCNTASWCCWLREKLELMELLQLIYDHIRTTGVGGGVGGGFCQTVWGEETGGGWWWWWRLTHGLSVQDLYKLGLFLKKEINVSCRAGAITSRGLEHYSAVGPLLVLKVNFYKFHKKIIISCEFCSNFDWFASLKIIIQAGKYASVEVLYHNIIIFKGANTAIYFNLLYLYNDNSQQKSRQGTIREKTAWIINSV